MKKIISILLVISMLFVLFGCTEEPKDEETPPTQEVVVNQKEALCGVSLWSFEIPSDGNILPLLEKYKDIGIDYIDFRILWSSFEPEKGKYNPEFFDSIANQILSEGFALGASLVFWTNGLSFANELEMQISADGETYAFDENRKDFPSLASEQNVEIMSATAEAFALHIAKNYPKSTALCQVITSPFGDGELPSDKDVDYGKSSILAFDKFLSENYDFESSEEDGGKILTTAELIEQKPLEWRLFKQKVVCDFQEKIAKIFKGANPEVPFQMNFGEITDTKTSLYRACFDPYTSSKAIGADLYATAFSKKTSIDFSAQYLFDTTDKPLGLIIYESDITEKTRAQLLDIPSTVKRVCFDLSEYKPETLDFIKQFSAELGLEKNGGVENLKTAILINTADMVLHAPATGLYSLFEKVYENLLQEGAYIHFVTDTMITANAPIKTLSKNYVSASSGKSYYITTSLSEALIRLGVEKIKLSTLEEVTIKDETLKTVSDETKNNILKVFNK